MLTPAQKLKHWRTWARVAAANDWRESGGRLDTNARGRADESLWHRLVWQMASRLALQDHRSVGVDDLRHACYAVATSAVPGRASARPVFSMAKLENWSFSRLLWLFALLEDSDNVTAAAHWEDPALDLRSSYLGGIKSGAPEAYIQQIAADRFGTRNWETLDLGQLRELSLTIRQRRKSWDRQIEQPF